MKMKQILPVLMFAAVPACGAMAQNKSGLVLADLDKTVSPATDFYQFATGGWQKSHPLPAAYSRYGSFDMLQENVNKQINTILTDLSKKKYQAGTNERKLSDFYKMAMDSARRNQEGIAPVKPMLDEMEAAKTLEALRQVQLKYGKMGFGVPFGSYFGADDKNVTMNIFSVGQGGLTLGQKDWYVNPDKATSDIREAFKKHIVRMFELFGFNHADAQRKMQSVFRFETELALVSKSNVELRDPQANYNKMTLAQFEETYPNIPLKAYTQAEGIDTKYIQELIVGQPAFFAGLDKLLPLLTADDLRAIMEWDLIQGSASYLSDAVREANFDFFGKTMSGRKEDYPLWKRATNQVQGAMGEALGKMYCERYFPAQSKKMMEELVHNLQVSLSQRIDAQTWMSDSTKANAHKKLDRFYVKIGYPNRWTDYSKLTIDPSKSFYENVMAARFFAHDKHIAEKAGKPVDREEWHMTPQTVNAYYNPTTNEICFPAGILQRPFFDAKADAAFNYGAIGVVIGHEMTHGFDDQGRQYDADGNLHDWWTAHDAKGFEERANLYTEFFNAIEVLPGLHCNGKFTLGENLADHGGLMVSFNAFKNATAKKPLKSKDGFTPAQRFFLAYAGVWGQNITEQEIRNRVKRDPHSLGEWRVNGALPHIDAWYEAFGVKKGDKMFIPESERLQLW
ncbi:M13 family metallopeptidase [Hallella sp.]|uniref:M13 family metallopeptidase n=1 Tax=Hallella sp. TaxID=2980186 RepID=UPI001B4716CE|nr:M13 family metallopeptidase [Hallella sp.]MBP6273573.1 M13 family metallopeptidase [Prevotella sp.]MCI7433613.1 M13 family metallopeptidase [Prevotella sp.]MDR3843862.1 M13 family metallopeptidase [Hallella sp.]MDY5925785.1 M13 family metallopeptidase [Hallella sp.]